VRRMGGGEGAVGRDERVQGFIGVAGGSLERGRGLLEAVDEGLSHVAAPRCARPLA